MVQIFPNCSTMTIRRVPGMDPASNGDLKVRFGKTRSTRYGCGGSGDPWMREVVQRSDSAAAKTLGKQAINRNRRARELICPLSQTLPLAVKGALLARNLP